MGKWTKFRKKLPRLEPDTDYQEKVNREKARILKLADKQKPTKADAEVANAAFLGRQMAQARRAKDRLEDKLYDENITITALDQLLVDRLEGEEQESVTLRDGVTFGLKDDIYPQVEDRGKLFAWIKLTGQAALLTVHHSTLKAVVKDRLENGRPAPPGTKVFIKTTVSIRGLKGKDNGDE